MKTILLEMPEKTAIEVRFALQALVRFKGHGETAAIVNVIKALDTALAETPTEHAVPPHNDESL